MRANHYFHFANIFRANENFFLHLHVQLSVSHFNRQQGVEKVIAVIIQLLPLELSRQTSFGHKLFITEENKQKFYEIKSKINLTDYVSLSK